MRTLYIYIILYRYRYNIRGKTLVSLGLFIRKPIRNQSAKLFCFADNLCKTFIINKLISAKSPLLLLIFADIYKISLFTLFHYIYKKSIIMEISSASIRSALNHIEQEYKHISGEMLKQATSRALNRSASSGRTESSKQIRQKYTLPASKINNIMMITKSTQRNLEASIRASGAPLSWNNFGAKQQTALGTTSFNRKGMASSRLNRKARTNAKRGVTATIIKGKTVNLPTAFIQLANGGITVFARGKNKGNAQGFEFMKKRLPIGNITTLSVPMMFGDNNVMQGTSRRVIEVLNERISHEINYLLSK